MDIHTAHVLRGEGSTDTSSAEGDSKQSTSLVNYQLALTRSVANNSTTEALASASAETEPRAAVAVEQQPLRELRVE